MKLLTPLSSLRLAEIFRRQSEQSAARDSAASVVDKMFPHDAATPTVSSNLTNAIQALQECERQDGTTEGEGPLTPRSMTQTALASTPVPDGWSSRRGAFSLGFSDRTDATGKPLHRYDHERKKWIPN